MSERRNARAVRPACCGREGCSCPVMLPLSAKHWLPTSAVLVCLAPVGTALACPDCPTARAARTELLSDPNLWAHVTLLLLPFVIVGVGWALASRLGPDRPVVAAGAILGVGPRAAAR